MDLSAAIAKEIESLPAEQLLSLLNDYFDAMARPVHAHGGEILKFIGDAMLAIFPMQDDLDRDNKCHVALRAAQEAFDALDALNEIRASAGKPPLRAGIGLHAGSVSYGNIGAVIGNPVLFGIGFTWIAFHAVALLLVARLIRAPTFFLAVGSQANIGGAASAPVVAAAFHPSLAPVGVLLAVLGYALGTYGGWVCGQLMRLVSR